MWESRSSPTLSYQRPASLHRVAGLWAFLRPFFAVVGIPTAGSGRSRSTTRPPAGAEGSGCIVEAGTLVVQADRSTGADAPRGMRACRPELAWAVAGSGACGFFWASACGAQLELDEAVDDVAHLVAGAERGELEAVGEVRVQVGVDPVAVAAVGPSDQRGAALDVLVCS